MDKKTIFIIILFILFGFSVIANFFMASVILRDRAAVQQELATKKIMSFRNLFTERVLLSNETIDFDTRLSLETAVRSLNDQEILAQWQKFTNSKTQEDATFQAKQLLKLLIQKTSN